MMMMMMVMTMKHKSTFRNLFERKTKKHENDREKGKRRSWRSYVFLIITIN